MPAKKSYRLSPIAWLLIFIFVAIPIDLIDLFFGWLPVLGTGMDLVVTGLAYVIAGPLGLTYVWEVIAFGPFNLVDGFVPTMSLIMLAMIPLGLVGPFKFRGKAKRRKVKR